MRIQRALWIACRARGVTKGRCLAVVEGWPVECAVVRFEQRLVADERYGRLHRRQMRVVGKRDPPTHLRAEGRKAIDQLRERRIEQHVAVIGVVDDPCSLLGEEPGVYGMADGPEARRAVI